MVNGMEETMSPQRRRGSMVSPQDVREGGVKKKTGQEQC